MNRTDRYHAWAVSVLGALDGPPLVCEPVITEACWHLRSAPAAVARVLEMPARGELEVCPLLAVEGVNLAGKVRKYGSRMDLADACVLRLAERNPDAVVITLDTRDFGIYRLHRDDPVPLLHPL
jgi:predicted nucleic acid-binding protein